METIDFSQQPSIEAEAPVDSTGGPPRGKDGYIPMEVETPFGDSGGSVRALLRLNEIPEVLEGNPGLMVALAIDSIVENKLSVPEYGFITKMTVISVAVAGENMLITLAPESVEHLVSLHLDLVSAAQIVLPKDVSFLKNARPGAGFHVVVELVQKLVAQPEVEQESLDSVDVEVEADVIEQEVLSPAASDAIIDADPQPDNANAINEEQPQADNAQAVESVVKDYVEKNLT